MSSTTRNQGANGNGARLLGGGARRFPRLSPSAARGADKSPLVSADVDLTGRELYIPQMPYGGSFLLAAALRSIGLDAKVTPDSDARTLELGGRYTSGDECYPQKVVMGDFMSSSRTRGSTRARLALLLPTANGPCRFGQYAALQRRLMDDLGYEDVVILSITSADGYAGIGEHAQELIRTAWRTVVANDILMKLLLKTRPYEVNPGQTDKVYQKALEQVAAVVSRRQVAHGKRLEELSRHCGG